MLTKTEPAHVPVSETMLTGTFGSGFGGCGPWSREFSIPLSDMAAAEQESFQLQVQLGRKEFEPASPIIGGRFP